MLQRLLRDRLVLGLPGLQFTLLIWWLSADQDQPPWLPPTLLLCSGLLGLWRSLRHARLVEDQPTARIASAAQGYVELLGRGLPQAGTPLLSPLSGLQVLWWRLLTEKQQSNGEWRQESLEQSQASFLLDDGSASCLIDPEGAEMLVRRREVTQQDDHRYTLWTLLPHDLVYVLGDFRTLAAAPELHRVSACKDGRLYLISDLEPGRIALRFKLWAGFHLLVLLGSAAALGWLAQQAAG